jgi:hypothetical protein
VIITQFGKPDGESSKCFGLNRYDTKPKRRLFEMLKSQGMQMNQAVTFLSAATLSAISKCTSTRRPSIATPAW